jgi:hypothetical protein
MRNLVAGPLFTITRYEGMNINGYTFYTMTQDKRASIKIVVCVYGPSLTTVMTMMMTRRRTHYGQIEEIWELDYVGLKVALFRCRWVTNGKRAVSKDKYILPKVLYIFCLYIFCFSSVTGKRRGLTNQCRHCYVQEMRTNEPASPLLQERDED